MYILQEMLDHETENGITGDHLMNNYHGFWNFNAYVIRQIPCLHLS